MIVEYKVKDYIRESSNITTLSLKESILIIVSAFLATISFSSYDVNKTVILAGVRTANADCPEDFWEGLVMTSVVYDDNYVVYSCRCDESLYEIDDFREEARFLKPELIQELRNEAISDEDVHEFLNTCRKAKVGIIYRYLFPIADGKVDVVIDYYEL